MQNVIYTMGDAVISCCGVILPVLEAEETDIAHRVELELTEDEVFIKIEHPMTKELAISFLAYVTWDQFHMVK